MIEYTLRMNAFSQTAVICSWKKEGGKVEGERASLSLQAMTDYKEALLFFSKDPAVDEALQQASALSRVAKTTEICGLLLELLADDGSKKNQARRACRDLLRSAEAADVSLPEALAERATQCVRMEL